ncbi:MAG TPA: hypothetical protein VJI74_00215 [Candidatus Paceibacterota bacterium]
MEGEQPKTYPDQFLKNPLLLIALAFILGVLIGRFGPQLISSGNTLPPLTSEEQATINERLNAPIPTLTPEDQKLIENKIRLK